MTAPDWKLPYLINIPAFQAGSLPLQNEGLREVAESFSRNTMRVKSLAIFPGIALQSLNMKLRIEVAAAWDATGQPFDVAESDPNYARYLEVKERLWEVATTQPPDPIHGMVAAFTTLSQTADVPEYTRGLEAWLSAFVVGTWTAFETLAGDLWEAALNLHPHKLADLKGSQKRIIRKVGGKPESTPQRELTARAEEGKVVALQYLQKYNYDLSSKMGTALKDRFRFDTLESLRIAYAAAFCQDYDRIDDLLANKEIDALALIRNLLVHKGGVADQRYLDRASGLPNCPVADLWNPLHLDGEIVADVVSPVVRCGRDLIDAVDTWVAKHST